ncbi:MAG: hypothetical protein IT577_16140, partial [Verrucomicrobiae bacterium]|nr:hypothetical protein [Verrucomicrobiae bacterium]
SFPPKIPIAIAALVALLSACGERELQDLRSKAGRLEQQNVTLQQEISALRTESAFTAQSLRDKEALITRLRAEAAGSLNALEQSRAQVSALSNQLAATRQLVAKASKKDRFAPLIRSLQTLNSSIETGLNLDRYTGLVASARTEFTSLDAESAGHPIAPLIGEYIRIHQTIAFIWSSMKIDSHGKLKVDVFNRDNPDLFGSIAQNLPQVSLTRRDTSGKRPGYEECYAFTSESLTSLWGRLVPRWHQIASGWQSFE